MRIGGRGLGRKIMFPVFAQTKLRAQLSTSHYNSRDDQNIRKSCYNRYWIGVSMFMHLLILNDLW